MKNKLLNHLCGILIVSGGVPCPLETRGALECVGDARTDIFRADVTLEFGLMHEFGGLFASAAEQQRAAGGVECVGEIADGAEARGIDGSHVSQP